MKKQERRSLGLTVAGHVQLDQVFEVLDVRRQPLDFIVAQAEFAKLAEPEKVLQGGRKIRKGTSGPRMGCAEGTDAPWVNP